MRRDDVGRVPVEAVLIAWAGVGDVRLAAASGPAATASAAGPGARPCRRARSDALRAAGAKVVAVRVPVLRLGVHDRVIRRIHGRVKAVAAADTEPIRVGDADARPGGTR